MSTEQFSPAGFGGTAQQLAACASPPRRAPRPCAGALAIPLIAVLIALPAFAGRALLQEMFYVFTMLALAQLWNLLAGSAGLMSVGQQAFVGVGAYALFAFTIVAGLDPIVAIVLCGRQSPASSPCRRR